MVRVLCLRKRPIAISALLSTLVIIRSLLINTRLATIHKIKGLFVAFLLIASLNCHADITILTSDSSRSMDIAKRIQEKITVKSKIRNDLDLEEKSNSIIITIGSSAFYKTSKKTDVKIIASFIPHTTNINKAEDDIFPYYSEPSPEQILSFFSKHFDSAKIGILYSDSDIEFVSSLESIFRNSNNTLIPIKHSKNDVFDSIRTLIKKDIDIMLITKNKDIYSSKKIRFVIEALSRKRIPTITTSPSLLRAGSAVSITPNEEKTINSIANRASQLHKNQKIIDDTREEPNNITVNINKSMMKLFNLNIYEGGNQ